MKNMFVVVLCVTLVGCEAVATLFHGEKPEPPALTYTVTFDANGAMGSPPSERTVTDGAVISLPGSGGLTKVGNRFVGWSESSSGVGVTYFFGDSVTVTGDMVFYAQWIDNSSPQYTITFNPNGATSGAPPALPPLYKDMIIIIPGQGTYTNSGKTFGGWNTEPAGTGVHYNAGSFYTVTGNITLYAKWDVVAEGSLTVTFNSNGGSSVPTQYVLPGGTATRPSDPILSGFIFGNWYSDSDLNTVFNFSTPITRNITLHAKWLYPEGMLILDVNEILPYLDTQTGGTSADSPVPLSVQINLGNMTQANSGWRRLMDAIGTADKYLQLDLSACTMSGTEFDPVYIPSGNAIAVNKIVSIVLPDTATSIAGREWDDTFSGFDALKSFSGASLTSIGNRAFREHRNLDMTSLPEGIVSIGNSAFWGCENLALTSLPAGLTSIGNYAFSECRNLALASLPAVITSIGDGTFRNCTNITLISPLAGFTSIGVDAFQNCINLAGITILASANITGNPFAGCTSLISFTLTGNGSLSVIEGGKALIRNGTELIAYPSASGNVTLPAGLIAIGDRAFHGCVNLDLTSLPAGITSIGSFAFFDCTGLTQMTLPTSLTSIGNGAFSNCTSLAIVTCLPETPPIIDYLFYYDTPAIIKVPAGSVAAYKAASGWSQYASRISAIE
jgi:hypothetical protein